MGAFAGGVPVSTIATPGWMDVTFAEDDSAYLTYQDSQNRVFVKHIRADGTLGTTDAGSPVMDAGSDAGTSPGTDAGSDAGTQPGIDAGILLPGGSVKPACSCSSNAAGSMFAAGLWLLGLVLARRRARAARH